MRKKGFTFIEVLIALTVIAVLFVPVMQLFSHSLYATANSLSLITATNLAKSEMEKMINLNLTKSQLRELGEVVSPPIDKPPFEINGTKWRVKREIVEGSDPLEVKVQVYEDRHMDKAVVTLTTLVEDLVWETVKPLS